MIARRRLHAAGAVGVPLSLLPFSAGGNIADDLARVMQERLAALAAEHGLRELFRKHGVAWRG